MIKNASVLFWLDIIMFFRHTLFYTYIFTVFYPDFLTAFVCIIFDKNVI